MKAMDCSIVFLVHTFPQVSSSHQYLDYLLKMFKYRQLLLTVLQWTGLLHQWHHSFRMFSVPHGRSSYCGGTPSECPFTPVKPSQTTQNDFIWVLSPLFSIDKVCSMLMKECTYRLPQLSSVQSPCWQWNIVNYTIRYIGDHPLRQSLVPNQ